MLGRGARRLLSLPIAAWLAVPTFAQDPLTDDEGLFNFVTRPEIRVPKLDVRVYNKDAVAPGYFFVAPYNTNNNWEAHHGPLFETCQVGPAIYDSNGDLIWSGACMFNNMNAFDFRPVDYGGKKYLSLNVGRGTPSVYGAGIILSDTYETVREIQMSGHTDSFNQHEFSVIGDGEAVLYVTEEAEEVSAAGIGLGDDIKTWARSTGIKEESLLWGHEETVNFEWDCIDYIPLNESTYPWPEAPEEGRGWDYMHMNSIDKFPDGDYLISMRYSNSIFRISGKDKSIVWRMGGLYSDFKMKDGFGFSRQHHARIISTNSTHTVVTLLDNAAGSLATDDELTADESSALVILLSHDPANTESWTAEILRRFARPDGDYSHLRGSFQILPARSPESVASDASKEPYPSSLTYLHDRYPRWETSNAFVGWSKNGYMTEFLPNGSIAAEARFVTDRLDTYRAYKHAGFVGRPAEPPVLKAFAFGDVTGQSSAVVDASGRGVGQTMTVAYASWNGATEVRAWRVYGSVVRAGAVVALGDEPSTHDDTYGLADPSSSSPHHHHATAVVSAPPSAFSNGDYQGSVEPAAAHKRTADRIPRPTDASPAPVTKLLGTFARAGFETVLTIPNAPVAAMWAEALDADGNVLGRTAVVRTVVPGAQRPYDPARESGVEGEGGGVAGDWAFEDGSRGFISLTKVGPKAGGDAGWGYASVRGGAGAGGVLSGLGFAGVIGVGAGVGCVAAALILLGWWAWVKWEERRRRRRRRREGGGRRKGWRSMMAQKRGMMSKGKGRAASWKAKGKYKAVASGEEGDEEEGLELVETGGSSDGESEDEYLGNLNWAPVFGRGTAGGMMDGGMAGSARTFNEEMTLGEVRRGLAKVREQEQRQRQGSVAEWSGPVPLVLQAKNKWNEGRSD